MSRSFSAALLWAALLAAVVCASPASSAPASGGAQVALSDEETVVFYGDSITEQNLYSAYLETFIASRFPHRHISTFNFGWGGDTAAGGHKRFARDVVPVKPSLVFVNFGMNDGGYKAFDEAVSRSYLEAQTHLADDIAATGARQVLFTPSPIDDDVRGDDGVYNDTLARMARGLIGLAERRGIPIIDLHRPMLEIQRVAKEKTPGFTMIPDSIHPDPVGHLVMAYLALLQIQAPRTVGEIVVDASGVQGHSGATVEKVALQEGNVAFDLSLPFIPFYVPPEARPGLDLVPFQDKLNRFRLSAAHVSGDDRWALSADGITLGSFSAQELEKGIDLALLDKAPWTAAGRQLWLAAQYRWTKHLEAWRRMGLESHPTMLPTLPTFAPFAKAQRAHADAMGAALQSLAQPGRYRLRLSVEGEPLPIADVRLSPSYPYNGDFDRVLPPETTPEAITWRSAKLTSGQIDLGAQYTPSTDIVAYVRVDLQAEAEAVLHLSMGSDDGLAVFVNGERRFAHDVARSLRPGEDEVEITLRRGRNTLLFKVTQGGGGYALAVEARVRGRASVEPVGR